MLPKTTRRPGQRGVLKLSTLESIQYSALRGSFLKNGRGPDHFAEYVGVAANAGPGNERDRCVVPGGVRSDHLQHEPLAGLFEKDEEAGYWYINAVDIYGIKF